MLTPLRRAVQELLAAVPAQRKPALRRTDDPQALLMTDLPRIAGRAAVEGFVTAMVQQGWRLWEQDGWLLMDHQVPAPDMVQHADFPGHWGCCVQLLMRHPGDEAPPEMIRTLVKAADVGQQRVEWLCRQWHAEFAVRLREHMPLPGGLLPYLTAARKEEMT